MMMKNIGFFAFLILSATAHADKGIYYQDKYITIYNDNTVVYTGSERAVKFKESTTWVEEDYFTQQEKYCEVDSNYGKKLMSSLKKSKTNTKQ